MDNFTHSLIGAALGQAGLKGKTGLAMPALIIAANLPDIDAPCVIFGVESLSMRRGITHGPIALLVLPLLLAAGLAAWDRWQTRRGTRPASRPAVHFSWLLALCYIGALSHPLFDWFNNYGIRLLEPFSSQWFYGDTLFIIDVWVLAMLGPAVWLSLRRERKGHAAWTRPARGALAGLAVYVAFNIGLSSFAAAQMRAKLQMVPGSDGLVVANPVPLAFWRREMLFRKGMSYGSGDFSLFDAWLAPHDGIVLRRTPMGGTEYRSELDKLDLAKVKAANPSARAFLFWSRMPVAQRSGDNIVLRDQRFLMLPGRSGFHVVLTPTE